MHAHFCYKCYKQGMDHYAKSILSEDSLHKTLQFYHADGSLVYTLKVPNQSSYTGPLNFSYFDLSSLCGITVASELADCPILTGEEYQRGHAVSCDACLLVYLAENG